MPQNATARSNRPDAAAFQHLHTTHAEPEHSHPRTSSCTTRSAAALIMPILQVVVELRVT
jgi:hypothetical protein